MGSQWNITGGSDALRGRTLEAKSQKQAYTKVNATNLSEKIQEDGGEGGVDEQDEGKTGIGGEYIGLHVGDVRGPDVLER